MQLDKYIFDSQFTFLGKDEELVKAYGDLVLSKAEEMQLGNVVGFTRKENWDSEKLDKYIGRLLWMENKVTSDSVFKEAIGELNEFDCCYIRLNSEHTFCKFAEPNGLKLMSKKVSQHLDLADVPLSFDEKLNYAEFGPEMDNSREIIKQVMQMAESSFGHNRFRSDPNFTPEMIADIYRSWIINEIKNKTSKLYLLLEGGKVASFFLYRENMSPLREYKIGFVSLIATSPEFKGKGSSYNLFNYVRAKSKKNGTNYMIANTESGNTDAIDFFKRNKFKVTSQLNEYHLWS